MEFKDYKEYENWVKEMGKVYCDIFVEENWDEEVEGLRFDEYVDWMKSYEEVK